MERSEPARVIEVMDQPVFAETVALTLTQGESLRPSLSAPGLTSGSWPECGTPRFPGQ